MNFTVLIAKIKSFFASHTATQAISALEATASKDYTLAVQAAEKVYTEVRTELTSLVGKELSGIEATIANAATRAQALAQTGLLDAENLFRAKTAAAVTTTPAKAA